MRSAWRTSVISSTQVPSERLRTGGAGLRLIPQLPRQPGKGLKDRGEEQEGGGAQSGWRTFLPASTLMLALDLSISDSSSNTSLKNMKRSNRWNGMSEKLEIQISEASVTAKYVYQMFGYYINIRE
jgi:hypothetical protein